MNKSEFYKQLEKGKITQIYFLIGEPYHTDQAQKVLVEKVLPGKDKSGLEIYYCDEIDVESVAKSIVNISLFSPKKVVVLKRADELTKDKIEILLQVVERPPENTFIIFIASGEPKNKSLMNVIEEKYNSVVKFPEYKKMQEIREFVLEELNEAGFEIEFSGLNLLVENSVGSLYVLKNEIEKLKLNCLGKKKITFKDVEESIFADTKEDFYGIFNAIVDRNPSLALKSFRSMIKKDYDYLSLLSAITTYFVGLFVVKLLQEKQLSFEELLECSGESNRYSLERKLYGARNYTFDELKKVIHHLARIDIQLKSSSLNKMALFDDFFLSLTNTRTNSSQS